MVNTENKKVIKKKIPKKVLHFLDFSVIVLSVLLLIHFLSPVLTPKEKLGQVGIYNNLHYNYRSEDENTVDVAFIGNSNAYSAVSPMCIWNETGIATNVSGKPFQSPEGAYKILKDIFKYQSPKAVFIDMDMFFSKNEKKVQKEEAYIHKTPIKAIKYSAYKFISKAMSSSKNAFEVAQNAEDILISTLTNYVPCFNFHNNWESLKLGDFKKSSRVIASEYKGFIPELATKGYMNDFDYMSAEIKDNAQMKDEKVLSDMIDFCSQRGVKVVLTGIPSADTWSYTRSECIKKISNKYSVEYLEMNAEGTVPHFNWATDTKDGGRHLNIYGAQKVSNYLADYLKKNFKFSDKRNDASYSLWNEANEKYNKMLIEEDISFAS